MEAWEPEDRTRKQITWIWKTYLEMKIVPPNPTEESTMTSQISPSEEYTDYKIHSKKYPKPNVCLLSITILNLIGYIYKKTLHSFPWRIATD